MAIIKSFYKILRVFPDPDYFYIQNEYSGSNTFTLTTTGTPASTDLEYSKDKTTWTAFDLTQSSNTVSLNSGEKLYLRSTTGFSTDDSNYLTMNCNKNFSVGGHIASLLDYQNIDSITAIPDYGFYHIFQSSNIISVENLDFSGITSVGSYGMCQMFYSCSQLTTGPDLSSVTSVGSYGMCEMFAWISGFTTTPDLSGLTSVGEYGMLAMFQYCSNLTTGLDLSSVTSIGDYGMMTMYQNCSSLNLVTAPNVSTWENWKFDFWLQGVASTGVVYKHSGLTIPTDAEYGVPTGWTTVDY